MQMKKIGILAAAFVFAATGATAEVVEAIVARVGDRIITRSQLQRRVEDKAQELRAVRPGEVISETALRKDVFDEMLSELLLKDRADRMRITVAPAEVEDAIKRLKAQYGIESDEEFEASLQSSGLTRADMEARLRDTLLTNKVFARELRSRAELTDRELKERYDREKEAYRLPERAQLREIVVVVPEAPLASQLEALRSRANEAAERARKGESFAGLVAEYSGSPSIEREGDIGTVSRGELMPELDAAVFNAQPGTVVGPVESRYGFHIVRVEQRLPSEVPGFDSVKERLRRDAGEESFQRDYHAYIERLRQEAYVQVFEKNMS
jgi:peptidyl-prolyl cis-trans isomerase SurA